MVRGKYWRVITLIVFLFLIGTQQKATGQTGTPIASVFSIDPAAQDLRPVAAQNAYRLALLVPFPDDPFWQDVQQAVSDRAITDGVVIDVIALSTPSVPEQLDQITQVIAAGYSGVLLGAVDATAIAPGIDAANTAGIPVLAIDTIPIGGSVISIVRTDNVAAARFAGQFLGQTLGDEGIVLNLQGDLTNPVAQERDQGLREGLAPFTGISIISNEGSWQRNDGYGWTSAQLPQAEEGTPTPPQPLVNAVFAASPDMALGAAQAVEDVQADTVTVVGFGVIEETLTAIRSGILEGVVAELPKRVGVFAVDLMVQHLNGEEVPSRVDSGSVFVTRDTVDAFLAATS